jgi:hypothetical protein
MGSSQSVQEENFTEVQKLKDILATNTETFNYNKTGGNTEQNYTEIQHLKNLLDADTETFSSYQVGSAGAGGRTSPTLSEGPSDPNLRIDLHSNVICIKGANKSQKGKITAISGSGKKRVYTVTLENNSTFTVQRPELYNVLQSDVDKNRKEAAEKAAEKAHREQAHRAYELQAIEAARLEEMRRSKEREVEEEARLKREQKQLAFARAQALSHLNSHLARIQEKEEEDNGAGGGGEDVRHRKEAARREREEEERRERHAAKEEEDRMQRKALAEEQAELARMKKEGNH